MRNRRVKSGPGAAQEQRCFPSNYASATMIKITNTTEGRTRGLFLAHDLTVHNAQK